MPFSAMSGQEYSISQLGLAIFQQDFTSLMGGTDIELVTMPIPPGQYELRVNATMGGINIFLPHYVRFTINGNSIMSGKDIHTGPRYWRKLVRKFRKQMTFNQMALPEFPPEFALTEFNPEQPVIIHLVLNTAMSGVNIYQL
jgi:hypothetical protein